MKKTGLVIIFMIIGIISTTAQQKILIDADTANEVDDIVAITRALMSDKVEIVGLTAAQWNNEHTWMLNTVEESWQLNNQILCFIGREDIPSRMGSEKLVSTRWAGNTIMVLKMNPQRSDASNFIVETALSMPPGEKLTIFVWALLPMSLRPYCRSLQLLKRFRSGSLARFIMLKPMPGTKMNSIPETT